MTKYTPKRKRVLGGVRLHAAAELRVADNASWLEGTDLSLERGGWGSQGKQCSVESVTLEKRDTLCAVRAVQAAESVCGKPARELSAIV